ncbi:NADPH2 dehydrogenase [Alternaria panax]|uniref:NADPH2 dehydrogenase n=1 Tax=Alternaria panax TaxID=48097 RepID=A0AAD4FEC2_9PLEO|nr:NADPH2 dehydrogenase [Alternaria panax]
MAPLTRLRADKNHVQLSIAVEYYAQRAAVPGTLIIAEANQISPVHGGIPHGPALWNTAHIAGWREITNAVHERGCSIVCQLVAPGRAADSEQLRAGGHELLSSSAVPMPGEGFAPKDGPTAVPRAMTEEQIWSCIADFAQAAKNAIAAGFDGVEIHGANGYLVDQFLQDTCNQRRHDTWGGSVENRSRFGIEVAKAVSAAIGSDRVGFRLSPWSSFQGMLMSDPIPTFSYLAAQLKELQLGYLHIIESRVNNNVDCESTKSVDFLLDVWNNVTPVLIAGGNTPDNAFEAADERYGALDIVFVFGRHFLSNPDLPYRLRNGVELNKYDRRTFYTPESPQGYIDYPFSKGFQPGLGL